MYNQKLISDHMQWKGIGNTKWLDNRSYIFEHVVEMGNNRYIYIFRHYVLNGFSTSYDHQLTRVIYNMSFKRIA